MASDQSPHSLSVLGLSDADVAGPSSIDQTHGSRKSNAGGILVPFYCQHSNLQCLSVWLKYLLCLQFRLTFGTEAWYPSHFTR